MTNYFPQVFRGSTIFGKHLARQLLEKTDANLILTGRSVDAAELARRELGALERTRALQLDLADPRALERAATDCFAVACTAGPFQGLPLELPRAAVRAGAHWLDISDVAGWVLSIVDDAELDHQASESDVCVIPGSSVVPAISGILARWCRARDGDADKARVTLSIGNRNPKGTGATASALATGFRDPTIVELPFGRKRAYRFESPDTELLRRALGLQAEFRVALEWGYLGRFTSVTGRLTRSLADTTRLARRLSIAARPFSRFGSDLGYVQVDVWRDDKSSTTSAAAAAGQRLVTLPCALAIGALLDGSLGSTGVVEPATWLSPDAYIELLRSNGVGLMTRVTPESDQRVFQRRLWGTSTREGGRR